MGCKTLWFIVMALGLFLDPAPAQAGAGNSGASVGSAEDEAAIRRIVADGTEAWNRRDAKGMTAHTTEDHDHINVNGAWRSGKAETEQALTAALATARNNMTSSIAKIRFLTPDVAVVIVRREYTDEKEVRKAISTSVFHKIDGTWWIEAFQNAYVVPPESRAVVEARADSARDDEIRRAEKEWVQLSLHDDGAGMGRILADEFTSIRTDGAEKTKTERMNAFRSGNVQTEVLEISDMRIKRYGDTALVTGLATRKDTVAGNARDFQYRYARVWILRDGRWQCVLMQSTAIGSLGGLSK